MPWTSLELFRYLIAHLLTCFDGSGPKKAALLKRKCLFLLLLNKDQPASATDRIPISLWDPKTSWPTANVKFKVQ